MNPKLIVLCVVIAVVCAAPAPTETEGKIETSSLPSTLERVKRDIILPGGARLFAGIPWNEYPPGVNPLTCLNYPYCDGIVRATWDAPAWGRMLW